MVKKQWHSSSTEKLCVICFHFAMRNHLIRTDNKNSIHSWISTTKTYQFNKRWECEVISERKEEKHNSKARFDSGIDNMNVDDRL